MPDLPSDPGSAPPLVLLPGALGTAALFDSVRALFPAQRDVRAVDLPGHGARRDVEALTLDGLVADLLASLDRAGTERVHAAGHSLGGFVALTAAIRHPDRIARVTTIGTKLRWSPALAERETGMLDPERMRAKVPAFVAELVRRHGADHWERLCTAVAALLVELGAGDPLRPGELARAGIPVRLCVGDRDALVPLEECLEAYRALPAGELCVLPATPHPLERTSPQRLYEALAG